MAKPVPVGAKGEARETVEFKHNLSAHHQQLPPVYSTPDMIRLMEIAAFHALHPFCDEGELNVGTHINIEHRAATGIGAQVLATAELESFDGRFYSFRVTAHDGKREIGRGTVGCAVINLSQFITKVKEDRG